MTFLFKKRNLSTFYTVEVGEKAHNNRAKAIFSTKSLNSADFSALKVLNVFHIFPFSRFC